MSIYTRLWFFILLIGSFSLQASPQLNITLKQADTQNWPGRYTLLLHVPEQHHAYLDNGVEHSYIPLAFDPRGSLKRSGVRILEIQAPKGVFEPQVQATVLRDSGVFTLVLDRLSNDTPILDTNIDLAVRYQLCNDVTHVCFMPATGHIQLSLPNPQIMPPAALPIADVNEEEIGITDRLLQTFTANKNNTALIFGLMLLAGLLSVATPCVYPMLPITSMFIINRAGGHRRREKYHALVYLLGIITTYMILGLVAGMTGGAFNSFMQSAWVNLVFAVFFAFFALSMLGFYEFSLLQNEVHSLNQRSEHVKGLPGTWLMGCVAGLVISPCVGPVVFAILLQVADNIAAKTEALAAVQQTLGFWDKLVIASQGSVMMGGFGLGVGVPFFVISVIKLKLPKAGYWMNKIKAFFGWLILYFAYTYFHKGMGVLGVDDEGVVIMALGLVALWYAIVHSNILDFSAASEQPADRLRRFAGVLLLLVGGWMLINGLNRIPMITTSVAATKEPASVASQNRRIENDAGIAWYRHFKDAQEAAMQTGKPIFIDFYASWCANCVAFKEETRNDVVLNRALREHAVSLKLIDQEAEFEQFKQRPEHRQLKIGLPYFAIVHPDGRLLWSGTDYQATRKIARLLTDMDQKIHPVSQAGARSYFTGS